VGGSNQEQFSRGVGEKREGQDEDPGGSEGESERWRLGKEREQWT
jgi:hypothetical protein